MEAHKRILKAIEKLKKSTNDPDNLVRGIEHWYDCKVEVDDGSSAEEHKMFVSLKEFVKIVLKRD